MASNRNLDEKGNTIVIVGGGPIGLIQAIGLKKLNSSHKVIVLEKNQTYQRSHNLIMQPASLEAVMKATKTEKELSQLLSQLRKDPHIRTNELEATFEKIAINSGVVYKKEEIKEENIREQLKQYKPDFIIGADGTRSVVNRTLFPKGNHVKVEFDYVLQCRYEVKGTEKAQHISNTPFIENMSRHGVVANEYVGKYDKTTQSTPITMQMMISKDTFTRLKTASSKNPIHLQKSKEEEKEKNKLELKYSDIPPSDRGFLTTYLKSRINVRDNSDLEKITISVNEAPATYAKQPATLVEGISDEKIPAVLHGDAGLGLSYFKGLNAGLLSSAKFFNVMGSLIQNGRMKNSEEANKALQEYTDWFTKDFAPKKVKEVESYSTWNIRSFMKVMKVAHSLKVASAAESLDNDDNTLPDLLSFVNKEPEFIKKLQAENGLYPHRPYGLIKLAQLDYIPLSYTAGKIKKLFADYIKSYKSRAQLIQDFKQPLVGLANVLSGGIKIVSGFFTFNIKRFADGILSGVRGAIEIATTPLAWILKPITRGIITLIWGKPRIENNAGMKRVADKGLSELGDIKNDVTKYKLLSISNDLHRKFKKSSDRGQETEIALAEQNAYNGIRANLSSITTQHFSEYFSLFAQPKQNMTNTHQNETYRSMDCK